MLRKMNLAVALLAMFAFANSSFASVYQTVDISTGVNVGAVGNPLYPANGRDDYWRVRSVPGTSYSSPIQSWIILLGTGWNTIPGTEPIFGNNNNVGTSEYERCFCLQSIEKAQLTLTMRADNKANLFLNSYFANPIMQALVNNTFSSSVPAVQRTYTAQSGLKVGKNCMRVRVNNEGGVTGFALKATVQGFGVQDTAEEPCCRQGSAVFSEALKAPAAELDPHPETVATPKLEVSPRGTNPIKRQNH
ncbi:MAG: hypothetical protein QOH41_2661 [Blastocatellia bacterium]|jgi:hypothetical protein|nr:hypothetical protein [Blastocatellia bacterium]